MSTSEKQEPEPDARCEELDRISDHIPCFIFAMCCAAFGFTSLTRINPEDNYLESMVKLLPVSGAATVIQAVIPHASLLRAIWKGRYPAETMSPCQRLAWNFYCCVFGLKHWRHIVGFHISALCVFSADHSLWKALRYAREIGERGRPSRAESAVEKGRLSTAESAAENSQDNPSTPPRVTIFCMLAYSFAGFVDLVIALILREHRHSIVVLRALFAGRSDHRHVDTARRTVAATHDVQPKQPESRLCLQMRRFHVFSWTCLALGFAMWYYKGRPLYPGVYAAGHWASALYMGVGEVLEQSLLSP